MDKQSVLFLGVGLYTYDTMICKALSHRYNVTYISLNPFKKGHIIQKDILSHLKMEDKIEKKDSALILKELQKVKKVNFDYK